MGELVGGRYRLRYLLGAGGFGQVWAADDTVLEVAVALKEVRLADAMAEERRELRVRAAREARHAARLRDHPHIVTVYDVVDVDGIPWIVMQLVEGRSLAEELRANGPLDATRSVAVAKALLLAVQAAHAEDITHRDIKPANVMLTDSGQVLLTDFGIAVNRTDTALTPTNLVIGTPGYTAPERWQGAPASGPSDLYSLGVTLYEAVEGDLPFPRSNPVAALTDTPREPRRAEPPMARFLAALLHRDPAARPSPAQALALLDEQPPGPEQEQPKRTPHTSEPDAGQDETPDEVRLVAEMPGTGERAAMVFAYGVFWGAIGFAISYLVYAFIVAKMKGSHEDYTLQIAGIAAVLGMVARFDASSAAVPDRVRINREGFIVTTGTRTREKTFVVGWQSLERIAVAGRLAPAGLNLPPGSRLPREIIIWYRPGHEPSKRWLSENGITKSADGGYSVYPLSGIAEVPLILWDKPLRTYAGPLYPDPLPNLDPS
ncbi:serine/threonine-protein kinase [Kitasatospora griseola]|uniref:serine/threonine-protein kinase n=1 Tax=Kitasatospora griseola TaxID=2064 RepID=UPI00364C3202